MSHTSYKVGSAFAQALSQATTIVQDAAPMRLRAVDLVNIGRYCAEEAHTYLQHDAAKARDMLIHGAARMLAVAEMLERPAEPGPSADVIAFPGAAGRAPQQVAS